MFSATRRPTVAVSLQPVSAAPHPQQAGGSVGDGSWLDEKYGPITSTIESWELLFMARDAAQRGPARCSGKTSTRRTTAAASSSPSAAARPTRKARAGTCASSRTASRAPSGALRAATGSGSRETAWCRCRRRRVGMRFTAAALAAGVKRHVTAHSGRGGLASELKTRRRGQRSGLG